MKKYPGTSGPESNKAECGSEPKTVVVGGVRSGKTDDKMFLQVYCRLPSGKALSLRVLIDTGCEVNLVREGVLPRAEFSSAKRRLNLTTANSQPMRGGDRSISTKLIFTRNMADMGKGHFGIDTDFYEADVNVDKILG